MTPYSIFLRLVSAALMLASLSGCSKLMPVDVGQGEAGARVLRVDTVHNQVTLQHSEIPNLIEAMTFSYPVKDRAILRGLHPLDTVTFTLKESSPGNFEVEKITRVK